MTTLAPLLVLSGLSKRFGGSEAVSGLSLTVAAGEMVALLGINGAGKTTTMRLLMGTLQPSGGSATIAGFDCFAARHQAMRHVGYLPDEPAFPDYLRGRELLGFVGEMHGLPRSVAEERIAELAVQLELAEALDEFAVNYSKGMRKKLALGLALMHRPGLLVLDEPTNGLDPYATRSLHLLLRRLAEAGTAVFFSTHLLDQAERLCQRVAVLHRGVLVACGPLAELRGADATLEDAFFRLTGAARA